MGKQGSRPGANRKPRAAPALLVREHEVPLSDGDTIVGRGPEARVAILGSLVSRRHAKLVSRDGHVTVEDLGSRNGVFVNGVRVDAPVMLEEGDTLLIGTTQMTFFLGTPDDSPPPQRSVFDDQGNMLPESEVFEGSNTRTAIRFESVDTVEFDGDDVTIQGSRPPPPRSSSAFHSKPVDTDPPPTPKRDVPLPESGELPRVQTLARIKTKATLSTLAPPLVGPAVRSPSGTPPPASVNLAPASSTTPLACAGPPAAPEQDPLLGAVAVIDRMLSRGDTDAAARTMAGHLPRRLERARAGSPLLADVLEAAALRCLSLLELTGDPSWFDLLLELYTVAREPMPIALLERITPFAGVVPSTSQQHLAAYQELIRARLGEVDVAELEACERILALGY